MLTVKDLYNIDYIPDEKDISLELLFDFFEQYLCKYYFDFKLEDGTNIGISFDTKSIYHLSGIKHIYKTAPMDASKFEQKVKSQELELINVQKINPKAYNDFINRIRAMFCLDTILKNSEYLYFSNDEIQNSNIKIKYLLLKGVDDKNIHLGIDSNNNKTYFGKTLLVTEGGAKDKYINKAVCKLKVSKLTISRKHTTEIVEYIERKKAYVEAKAMIESLSSAWIENKLPTEVEKILLRDETINNTTKKGWIKQLEDYLNQEKDLLRKNVEIYDPYWKKKIVAEEIREYINNSARTDIDKFLTTV